MSCQRRGEDADECARFFNQRISRLVVADHQSLEQSQPVPALVSFLQRHAQFCLLLFVTATAAACAVIRTDRGPCLYELILEYPTLFVSRQRAAKEDDALPKRKRLLSSSEKSMPSA